MGAEAFEWWQMADLSNPSPQLGDAIQGGQPDVPHPPRPRLGPLLCHAPDIQTRHLTRHIGRIPAQTV